MSPRLDQFLKLSVHLTGFGQLELLGTGVGQEYLQTVEEIIPEPIVGQLFDAAMKLIEDREHANSRLTGLLDDAVIGPVARNIIVLWYCGTWTPLPAAWCETNGRSPLDVGHVVSSASYLAGLQWATVGAHPPGGLPGGFASWASMPEGVRQ